MDQNECLRIARHEAAHGLFGTHCGIPVESIRCAPWGETIARLPLQTWELKPMYQYYPARTMRQLVQILGMINAPSIVQNVPLGGGDADHLAQWRHAWARGGGQAPWSFVLSESREVVRAWSVAPGTQRQLTRLAGTLAQRRVLDGKQWQALLDEEDRRSTAAADYHERLKKAEAFVCSHMSSTPSWRDYAGGTGVPLFAC